MSMYWWVLLLGATLAYSAYVSARVLKSDIYDSGQKRRQLLIVWSFPVLGAFLAFGMLRQTEEDGGKGEDALPSADATPKYERRTAAGHTASAFVAD